MDPNSFPNGFPGDFLVRGMVEETPTYPDFPECTCLSADLSDCPFHQISAFEVSRQAASLAKSLLTVALEHRAD